MYGIHGLKKNYLRGFLGVLVSGSLMTQPLSYTQAQQVEGEVKITSNEDLLRCFDELQKYTIDLNSNFLQKSVLRDKVTEKKYLDGSKYSTQFSVFMDETALRSYLENSNDPSVKQILSYWPAEVKSVSIDFDIMVDVEKSVIHIHLNSKTRTKDNKLFGSESYTSRDLKSVSGANLNNFATSLDADLKSLVTDAIVKSRELIDDSNPPKYHIIKGLKVMNYLFIGTVLGATAIAGLTYLTWVIVKRFVLASVINTWISKITLVVRNSHMTLDRAYVEARERYLALTSPSVRNAVKYYSVLLVGLAVFLLVVSVGDALIEDYKVAQRAPRMRKFANEIISFLFAR